MKKEVLSIVAISLIAIICLAMVVACAPTVKRDYLLFYVWGDNAEVANYEKIAGDFTALTGIQVKVQPATGDYYDNLNISFSSAENAPDLFFTESGEFLSHIAADKLLDLSDYIANGKLDVKTSTNPDGQIELWDINDTYRFDGENTSKGDYYAVVKDWSPDFVMWYNKSHIDEYNAENNLKSGDVGFMDYPSRDIPMTWDEFAEMSYKLRKQSRYGTMLDRVPYKHLMEWIQMTGSSVWTQDGMHFNYEDPNVLKAFRFFTDLQLGSKASAPVIGPTGVGSGQAFANGNLSFAFFGNWAYSTYAWDSVGFEIGYCPSPVPAKANGAAITKEDTYAGCCAMIALAIHKNSSMKDEAVQFLNYYMTKGSEYMATKGFNIPGNKAIANSDIYANPESAELAEINRYFLNIANNYTHAIVYNKAISQDTFENIIGKYMSDYLANPTGTTLQKVLENIASDINREL